MPLGHPSKQTDGSDTTKKNYLKLKEAIFARRPILRDIITKHGSKSLYQYAQDYLNVNLTPLIQKRQKEFFVIFEKEVERLFGVSTARAATKQLAKYYFVSSADHHGPVVHPFFLNSDLIIAASYDNNPDPLLQYVIVLSCSNVSLSNSSFPRGLLFTSDKTPSPQVQRLSFLPSSAHSAAVYTFHSYTAKDIQKVRGAIKDQGTKGLSSSVLSEKLNTLLSEVYDQPAVLACESFSDQVSKTNRELWRKFLENPHKKFPDLLYIEQERLVTQLLLHYHLDQSTMINFLLFHPEAERAMYKYFEGIMGAFSRKEKWGTYLFWGVNQKKNYRLHLWKQGSTLVSEDGSFTLELTAEAIREALEKKQIIPSMMLIFVTLSFYYGLKCLGGPNQVNCLTLLKKAYIDMCEERGDTECVDVCTKVQTKEFVEGPTIAFLEGKDGNIFPANGVDLYLFHNGKEWQKILDLIKTITLEESFDPRLPDYYPLMYPEVDRIAELSMLTAEQIIVYTGLDRKIKPCISLSSDFV